MILMFYDATASPCTIQLLDCITRTMYIHAVRCYRPSRVVCQSVCHTSE